MMSKGVLGKGKVVKSCVNQIFVAIKMLVAEYLGKDKKLYATFMDLEKAYDRVDRKALWNVLKI